MLEGATPAQVDSALEGFGMAMGILAVFDMAGVDTGVKVRQANPDQGSSDPSFYRADQVLYGQGWVGQKSGRGYYRYEQGSRDRHEHPKRSRCSPKRRRSSASRAAPTSPIRRSSSAASTR